MKRKRLRKRIAFISVLFLSFTIAILSGAKIFSATESQPAIISPIPENADLPLKIVSDPEEEVRIVAGNELPKQVEDILADEKGTYGIYFKNLQTGEIYTRNESYTFETASLYKLFVMAKTYEEIANDRISLDTTLSDTVERLNQRFDIDPEYAELTEGGFTMTVDEALEEMITISHNYAALLLSSKLGISNVQGFMDRLGLSDSRLGSPPVSTPNDIARFFELLYERQIVSESASNEMLDRLLRQKLNDRIPAGLPEGIDVAHKTGELGGYKHDTGIVFDAKGDYILILMSETPSQERAIEVEAELSKAIYEYFLKSN